MGLTFLDLFFMGLLWALAGFLAGWGARRMEVEYLRMKLIDRESADRLMEALDD